MGHPRVQCQLLLSLDRRGGTVIGTGHRHRDLPDSILLTLYVYLLSTLLVFHLMCPLHLLLDDNIVLATYVGLGYLFLFIKDV